ncbi:MAG TPA: arginine N-succinyltransferase [Caulobacteraceae bacterium]|nr:arginine N-succinyltransferase [Caulobacteraceae bacterium]
MLVVRPAGPDDFDALWELALASGPGFTSLPDHEPTLRQRLVCSQGSFDGSLPREDCWYVLMLENAETGEIDGIAGVKAAVGLKRPFASFRRVVFSHYHVSDHLEARLDQPALLWVNECRGWSEVGSLYLKPDRRTGGAGSLLARSRYMLIGADTSRFSEWVLAELRGVIDDQGNSPFWDHVTSKFFPIDFAFADELSGSSDGQFIFDLAPHHPIYENLLPEPARDVIGRCHPDGIPAKVLLEKEGFRDSGLVDVFDAGPTVACHRDAIRTVKDSRRLPAAIVGEVEARPVLVSADSLAAFRSTRAPVDFAAERAYLGRETAELLKVKDGDMVRVIA